MGGCCSRQPSTKQRRSNNWVATGIVSLRDARLSTIPADVWALGSAARVLDATNNQLREVPEQLASLAGLQRLVLSQNSLVSVPDAITTLTQLKLLALDGNRLPALPSGLGALGRLQTLNLSSNALVALPASIRQLSMLRSLSVAGNALAVLPEELGECSALEEVDASNNQLTAIPPSLGRLAKLNTLQLDSNRISAVPSALFEGCGALATLSLHNNPVMVQELQTTPGYAEYEARRRGKFDKAIAGGALMNKAGLDEGVDRPLMAVAVQG